MASWRFYTKNNKRIVRINFKVQMAYEYSSKPDQNEQLLDIFSNYLNDTVRIINSVKKSIYKILNIPLNSTQVYVQPNFPSVSVNCKKTLDDLKRISSILKGYSQSKNMQRQDQETRKSRVQNFSLSRSKKSRISNTSNHDSCGNTSKFKKPESIGHKQQISMVTFQVPHNQDPEEQILDDQFRSKLRNYRSLKSLSKTTELQNQKSGSQNQNVQAIPAHSNLLNSPINMKFQNHEMSRKRARTLQNKSQSKSLSVVVTETEFKFKQCLSRHQNGMDQIIRRNSECLQILKDIHKNLKNKKARNPKQPSSKKNNECPVRRYQAMTTSSVRREQITVN